MSWQWALSLAAIVFASALAGYASWQIVDYINPRCERALSIFSSVFSVLGTIGVGYWRLRKRGREEKIFDPKTASTEELYREGRDWAFGFKAEAKEKTAFDENGNEILDENGAPRKLEYRVFNVGKGVGYLKTVAKRRGSWATKAEADLAFLVRRGYEDALPNPAEALERAQKPAKKGNPFACYVLGRIYDAGEGGVEKDEEKAKRYFRQAFEGLGKLEGDSFATNLLGRFYDKGWGVDRDEKKAAEHYAIAANAGYADGKNRLAVCLSDGVGKVENKARAFKLFKEAAEAGHMGAKVNLGRAYVAGVAPEESGASEENGASDEKAKKEAIRLFEEAAAAGSDEALNALGECFLYGDGVKANPEKAREYFDKSAKLGLVDAILNLGRCWYNGRGGEKDRSKGVELYKIASDKGNDAATTRLGRCYYYGEGVPEDKEEAARCFEKAADQGNSLAAYLLGNYLFETGDKENAIKRYEASSAKGRVDATMKLAFCYRYGEGVERDEKKAREMYAEAAKANHAVGMFMYALCWRVGFGGESSDSEARKWFERAAKAEHKQAVAYLFALNAREDATIDDEAQNEEAKAQVQALFEKARTGDAEAWYKIGEAYLFGVGVKLNWREALKAYKRAANLRCVAAMTRLAVCYLRFAGEPEKAVSWFRRAADMGRADAMYALSVCFYAGHGVAQNPQTAFEWLRKAAEFGNPVAMRELAFRYETGADVEPDPTRATRWYRKAADYGDADAMRKLGEWCESGEGGFEFDPEQAARWYRMAADYGSALAMRKLGRCFENGFGVKPNAEEAARWLRMADDWGAAENNEATLYADAETLVDAIASSPEALPTELLTLAAPEEEPCCDEPSPEPETDVLELRRDDLSPEPETDVLELRRDDMSPEPETYPLEPRRDEPSPEPEAHALYRRASTGDARATFELGKLYAEGRGGVERSLENAFRCWRRAANMGLPEGANALAWHFEKGQGVPKNVDEALRWYRKAEATGDKYAAKAIARLTRSGN